LKRTHLATLVETALVSKKFPSKKKEKKVSMLLKMNSSSAVEIKWAAPDKLATQSSC
jgi:hypothetical protein